jgi:hypothetical protein
MDKRTDLASGPINGSDQLLVELIERPGKPTLIGITWPVAPTVCRPAQFDQVVANAMRLLSNAVVELAAIRVHRRL